MQMIDDILAHLIISRRKQALSLLGIVLSTGCVFGVWHVAKTVREAMAAEMDAMGTRQVLVSLPYRTQNDRLIRTISDWEAVARISRNAKESFIYRTHILTLQGTDRNYAQIQGLQPAQGRNLHPIDLMLRRAVCVIGRDVNNLYFDGQGMGEWLHTPQGSFRVIGVLAPAAQSLLQDDDYAVLIPFSLMSSDQEYWLVETKPGYDPAVLQQRVEMYLDAEDRHDATTVSQEQLQEVADTVMGMVQNAFLVVSLFSCVVSMVALAQQMLASIESRKEEIGIRKALGATSLDITALFLIETLVVIAFGLVLGVTLGGMILFLLHVWLHVQLTFDIGFVALFGIGSLSAGCLICAYPAYLAGKKSVMSCLQEKN